MKNNMLPLNENYIQRIKSKYNDEQQEAIFVDKVSALVSAGAGSGKTAVLSERTIAFNNAIVLSESTAVFRKELLHY